MKRKLWCSLAALCLAMPAAAFASEGYVVDNVNLRAGPDPSYPLVDQMPAGTAIDVQGCTEGWEWCDVINEGDGARGWIAGNYIQYQYQDQQVFVSDYGAQIGIPIVGFSVGTYWDRYYRSRPFYGDRGRWYRQPYVRRGPPPPPRGYGPGRGGPGGGGPGNTGPWRGGPDGRYGGHPDGGRPGQGYDPGRPGHLGPVGPAYPVRSIQNGRPMPPQGQDHQGPGQQGPGQQGRPGQQGPIQGRPQPAPGHPANNGGDHHGEDHHDNDHHDDNGH